MLPAIAYVLNFFHGHDLAEPPVYVRGGTSLKQVIELMQLNSIREIPVVDDELCLIGTIEAKSVLAHYLKVKTETEL